MSNNYLPGKVLLWIMIAHHGIAGVLLIASGDLSLKFVSLAFGWTIEGTPTLGIAGEVLGCYLVAFALMLVVVTRDPEKHRALITVALALIVMRLAQRVYFSEKVMEVFQVPQARYWGSCGFVLLLAILLGLFRMQVGRATDAASQA